MFYHFFKLLITFIITYILEVIFSLGKPTKIFYTHWDIDKKKEMIDV